MFLKTLFKKLICPFELKINIEESSEKSKQILKAFIDHNSFENLSNGDSKITFKCGLKFLIGGFRFSNVTCTLESIHKNKSDLVFKFVTFQKFVLTIFTIISLLIVLGVIVEGDLIKLLFIPVLYSMGTYWIFWSSIWPTIPKLKTFKNNLFSIETSSHIA